VAGGSGGDVASEGAVREEDHTSGVAVIGAARDAGSIVHEGRVIRQKFGGAGDVNTSAALFGLVVGDTSRLENERRLSRQVNGAAISGRLAVFDFDVGEHEDGAALRARDSRACEVFEGAIRDGDFETAVERQRAEAAFEESRVNIHCRRVSEVTSKKSVVAESRVHHHDIASCLVQDAVGVVAHT